MTNSYIALFEQNKGWEFPGGKTKLNKSTYEAGLIGFKEKVGVDLIDYTFECIIVIMIQ